jgi:hypothetical protein
MRAAIEAGLENAPIGVVTTPGTKTPKYIPGEPRQLVSPLVVTFSCFVPLVGGGSSLSNKKAPSLGPNEWITKETLVYRHSYLNPMSAVFDDVTNCDAGFD